MFGRNNISNTKNRVWPHFQTLRRELKIRCVAEYFSQTLRFENVVREIKSALQTSRISSKILRCVSYFLLSVFGFPDETLSHV